MQSKKFIMGLSLMVFGGQLISFNNQPQVVVCDVGQGNGVLIQEGNIQILDDVGPESSAMVRCLEKYMPAGDKEIEGIIISHWDSDHSGGLAEIEKYYKIGQVWANVAKNGATELHQNDRVEMGSIWLDIMSPGEISGDDNKDSVVVKITSGNFKMLLMGDVTAEEEEKLVWRKEIVENIPLLLLSHHGSGTATSTTLIDQIKPTEVLISVGKNNRFGHPNGEVINRLNQAGIKIKRTDQDGTIVIPIE